MENQSFACHSERSQESLDGQKSLGVRVHPETIPASPDSVPGLVILRFAQNDKVWFGPYASTILLIIASSPGSSPASTMRVTRSRQALSTSKTRLNMGSASSRRLAVTRATACQ